MYHSFYWLMHVFIFGTLCGDYIGSGQDNHGILNQGCFNTAYAAQNPEQNRQNFERSLSLQVEEPLDLRSKHANDTYKNLDVSASNPTLSFQKVEDIANESEKHILWQPIKANTVSTQNLKSLSYGLLEKPYTQIDLTSNNSQQAKFIVAKSQDVSYENYARTSYIQEDKAIFCGSISAENVDLTHNAKPGNSLDLIKEDRDNISPKCHKKKDDIYSKTIAGSSKQNWSSVMSNHAEVEKEREKSNKIPIIESTDECEKVSTYKAPVKQPLTCKNRKRKYGSKGQDDCEGSGTKKIRLKTHQSDATVAGRGQASVPNPVTMESQHEQQVCSKEENIDSTFEVKSVKKKKVRYDFIKKHIDNLTKNTQIISFDLVSFKEYCRANKELQTECKNQFVIHQREYLMDVKNDCNETVSAVLEVTKGLSYSATLGTIEKRFKETTTTTELNLKLTDLEYKDGLPPVTRHAKCLLHGKKESADFIKKSNFLLKVCCTEMANGISLVAKCNIFSYFVCEMLLSRESTTGKLRLKSELRKLQLFMPEIYFYVFWRLQFITEIVAININYQHKFQEEMHCIYFLVESFYRYTTTIQYYVFCLKTKENMIVKYRRFIKELLEDHHFESVQYCFYDYALNLAANTEKQTNKKVTADVMFILAFTAQSAAFEEIARDFNLEKKSRKGKLDQTDESKHQNDKSESVGNKKDEEIPDKRARRKIGNQKPKKDKKDKDQVGRLAQGKSTQAKKKFLSCFFDPKIRRASFRTEIISILQNLVDFMMDKKLNASSTSLKDDQNSYLIFKYFTIVILNAENEKVVNIKILHNKHIRRHFYEQITRSLIGQS